MVINESAVQAILKSSNFTSFLKQKQYNEILLVDFLTDIFVKNKKAIGYDFIFIDPFISINAVAVNIIFGTCNSYYNKYVNKGFEQIGSKQTFTPNKINQMNVSNIGFDSDNIPDNLPGTKNSTPNEFFNSNTPVRVFYYVNFKFHYSFNTNQTSVKKFNLPRL